MKKDHTTIREKVCFYCRVRRGNCTRAWPEHIPLHAPFFWIFLCSVKTSIAGKRWIKNVSGNRSLFILTRVCSSILTRLCSVKTALVVHYSLLNQHRMGVVQWSVELHALPGSPECGLESVNFPMGSKHHYFGNISVHSRTSVRYFDSS